MQIIHIQVSNAQYLAQANVVLSLSKKPAWFPSMRRHCLFYLLFKNKNLTVVLKHNRTILRAAHTNFMSFEHEFYHAVMNFYLLMQ